jgi:hypothetical protein
LEGQSTDHLTAALVESLPSSFKELQDIDPREFWGLVFFGLQGGVLGVPLSPRRSRQVLPAAGVAQMKGALVFFRSY